MFQKRACILRLLSGPSRRTKSVYYEIGMRWVRKEKSGRKSQGHGYPASNAMPRRRAWDDQNGIVPPIRNCDGLWGRMGKRKHEKHVLCRDLQVLSFVLQAVNDLESGGKKKEGDGIEVLREINAHQSQGRSD
jgi:hypothetical protein